VAEGWNNNNHFFKLPNPLKIGKPLHERIFALSITIQVKIKQGKEILPPSLLLCFVKPLLHTQISPLSDWHHKHFACVGNVQFQNFQRLKNKSR
jgi:hypothetical protein